MTASWYRRACTVNKKWEYGNRGDDGKKDCATGRSPTLPNPWIQEMLKKCWWSGRLQILFCVTYVNGQWVTGGEFEECMKKSWGKSTTLVRQKTETWNITAIWGSIKQFYLAFMLTSPHLGKRTRRLATLRTM